LFIEKAQQSSGPVLQPVKFAGDLIHVEINKVRIEFCWLTVDMEYVHG